MNYINIYSQLKRNTQELLLVLPNTIFVLPRNTLSYKRPGIVSASTLRNLYLLFQVCRKRSIYVLYEFIKYSIGTFVDIH